MKCEIPLFLHGQPIPCGKCSACLHRKRDQWVVRLTEQAKESNVAFFLTLTYRDDCLVYGDSDQAILIYDHLKAFHKANRKKGFKYKYFSVGEYGEKSGRPHFHLLVFSDMLNFNFQEFAETWKYGGSQIGSLTDASIKYCTKDMLKEVDSFNELDKTIKPRIRVSQGIGLSYVTKMKYWHKTYDQFRHENLLKRNFLHQNGTPHALPRYFADKIYNSVEKGVIRNLRCNTRSYTDVLLASGNKKALEDEINRIQTYTQGVERRKKKRLQIHHFNKTL